MPRALATCLLLAALAVSFEAPALSYTIAKGSALCDAKGRVCMSGRIDYDVNRKLIEIQGRLNHGVAAGILQFEFVGVTPLEDRLYHAVEIAIDGRYSEIIDYKFGPPLTSQTRWELLAIRYQAGEKSR